MLDDFDMPVGDHEFAELAPAFSALVHGDEDGAVVAETLTLLDSQCLRICHTAVGARGHFCVSQSPRGHDGTDGYLASTA
jgi:hypothetical protein